MRRSKQQEEQSEPAAPSNVAKAPALTPATLPRARTLAAPDVAENSSDGDDLERGRTVAMVAALGRVTLTLDLIERRLGRMEDAILEIAESQSAAGPTPPGGGDDASGLSTVTDGEG